MTEETVRIRLLKMVRSDIPIGIPAVAMPGIYNAEMNAHGAISVRTSTGVLLGVKPGEFEFTDEIPEQWRNCQCDIPNRGLPVVDEVCQDCGKRV
jgi:hypothetical protein